MDSQLFSLKSLELKWGNWLWPLKMFWTEQTPLHFLSSESKSFCKQSLIFVLRAKIGAKHFSSSDDNLVVVMGEWEAGSRRGLHLYYFLNNCSFRKRPQRIFWSCTQRSQFIVDRVFLTFTAPCGFATYEDMEEAFAVIELFISKHDHWYAIMFLFFHFFLNYYSI